MMCYRDMTFCPFSNTCKKEAECPRALTQEVYDEAKEWWKDCKGKPPICMFLDKPECHEEV